MVPKEAFHLEGRSYSRSQLLDYCQLAADDMGIPTWKRDVLSFIQVFLDPSLGDIVQFTSGTTGDPKVQTLNRESMMVSARKTLEFFNLQAGNSALLCLPIRYIAGKMMVVRALLGELDLILAEPSGRPLKALSQAVHFAAMVPLQVHETLDHGDNISAISTLIIGGGELQYHTREKLSHLKKPLVFESFGMTETYTHFALKRINGTDPDSCFKLLKGVSISRDHRNCLVVNVSGVSGGALTSNDLVEIDSSGKSFRWLGRYDHVINSGGIKLNPELLEEQIRKLIGCDCLILPEPDERLGERLVLLVETDDNNPPLERWLTRLGFELSVYEVPKRIVVVRKIPRNHSMKKDRGLAIKLIIKN